MHFNYRIMKIDEVFAESVIDKLITKYGITRDSLFGRDIYKKNIEVKARGELIFYLKINGIKVMDISKFLGLSTHSIYYALKKISKEKKTNFKN